MTLLRDEIAVVGIANGPFGSFPEYDDYAQMAIAFKAALDDAGLEKNQIDGLITHRLGLYTRAAEVLGINPDYAVPLLRHGRMSGVAIQNGVAALLTGQAKYVALVYGNNGRSVRDLYGGGGGLWAPFGMSSPGAEHALLYERYRQKYAVTPEKLATVSLTLREHARLNPEAVMQKPLTLDDYMNARFIVEPLRLFDYCLINDGAVVMILTTKDRAKDLKQPPVYISGVSTATDLANVSTPPRGYWREAMAHNAERVYPMAGIDREDLSGLMIYDNFAPNILYSLEGYGFCKEGEAPDFIQGGRIALGGDLPVNTSGGHLSESYMQGWALNTEAVRQLRHQCGKRQIKDAKAIQYICSAAICSSIIYRR
ncbi:MAG: thiolase family protein [Salinarimonadaceae bacterium]|nr:MAG: thiolase family protein [Salinarimonadaceae bacterium]